MKTLKLNSNKECFIDDDDFERLKHLGWCFVMAGKYIGYVACHYRVSKRNYKRLSLHRIIMNAKIGDIVDHIDGNTLNNCKSNLRLVSARQNCMNRVGKRGEKPSKFKGVFFVKNRNKSWRARIVLHNVRYSLGYFETQEEAALAYDAKAKVLFKEYARLNLP